MQIDKERRQYMIIKARFLMRCTSLDIYKSKQYMIIKALSWIFMEASSTVHFSVCWNDPAV